MFILPIRGFDMRRAIWITTGILLALFAGFSVWYFGGAKSQALQSRGCADFSTVSDVWTSSNGDVRLHANEECGRIWLGVQQHFPENNRVYIVGYSCDEANASCRGESKSVSLNSYKIQHSESISLTDYKAFRICWSPYITSGPFVFCSSKYSRADMSFPKSEPTYPGADYLMMKYGPGARINFFCEDTTYFEKFDIEFFYKGATFSGSDIPGTMPRPAFRLTIDPNDNTRNIDKDYQRVFDELLDCIEQSDSRILEHEGFKDSLRKRSLYNQLFCHIESDEARFYLKYTHTQRADYHLESFWMLDDDYAPPICNGTEYF